MPPDLLAVIHESLFYQFALILLIAGVMGFAALQLRQPLIVAFIAAGLLIGPDALNIVSSESTAIETLAKIGISLLLFMVGLKLDINLIHRLGGVALATAVGQMAFTAASSLLICLAFGFDPVSSLYIAVALTFSSTIIIVKLLSDKREIDSLHGRIALGFLIVEDIFVIVYMVLLSTFAGNGGEGSSLAAEMGLMILKLAGMGIALILFVRFVATPLVTLVAASPEMIVTFAIAWATAMSALADTLGFSIEFGGLLAGVALASTPYRDVLSARLSSIRDFMLLFFFVILGSHMNLHALAAQLVPALVLSAFVLIGKPLAVTAIMGRMGYRKRTSFLAGMTVAQISEFSLILVTMGLTLGHVGEEMLSLITLVALITISLSTYMIVHSQGIYAFMENFLTPFERKNPHRERETSTIGKDETYDVILFGLGRYGFEMATYLLNRGTSVLGLDFDPDAVRHARQKETRDNFDVAYGDVSDPDFATHLPLAQAKWVVCAVPHHHGNPLASDLRLTLLETLKLEGFQGKTAMVSHGREETRHLKEKGADLILTPFPDAARQAVSEILTHAETDTRND